MTTHRTYYREELLSDKSRVQTLKKDAEVGQNASNQDQVVHVGTGHFYVPGCINKLISSVNCTLIIRRIYYYYY